jgi:hypothetical protein
VATARALGDHIVRRAWELVGRGFAEDSFASRLLLAS